MKFLHGEPRLQRFLRFRALYENFQLADLVRAGLSGPDDVTIYFCRRYAVVERLLACPVQRMEAGVDDEAPGAKQLV